MLEVGAGSCMLLAKLSELFAENDFTGIEPLGPGHQRFTDSLQFQKENANFKLHLGEYENFNSQTKYDFIFSINVLEHLPDWRDFFVFVKRFLTEGGQCITLCPNYGFPYESHFVLPMIVNSALTEKIFRRKIVNFERESQREGLWSSLNFVKWSQIKQHCKELGLKVEMEKDVMESMVKRLYHDSKFADRQRYMVVLAKTLYRLKFFKIFEWSILQNVQPYIQFKTYL